MEPEPVVEPTPAPASERPVRAAAQKAAQKKAEEAEAAAKKKAAGGKASAAALQKKLAAQKEAASAVEAAQKARIEELEAELLWAWLACLCCLMGPGALPRLVGCICSIRTAGRHAEKRR